MRAPAPDPTSIEDLLETGLLDQWYLIARDTDIGNVPVALKRLNRDLVVWRSPDGKVNAVHDYCPHRGAKLSLGKVADGPIACSYHGVQVDGRGTVVATPANPNSPCIGQQLVFAYPCQERHGAVWAYFGDGRANADVPELRFPAEFTSGEWSGFVDIREFTANWQLVRDNQFDPAHGSYLHAGTHALSWGRKDVELGFERTDLGFVVWRTNQQGVNLDRTWLEHYPGSGLWAVSDIPYPRKEGGGFALGRLFRYPTPIDRERTLVWNYRMQPLSGWKRDLWRFLYRNRASARGAEVLQQDAVALASIPNDALPDENLLQCDIGVAQIRRLYREEARRQLERRNGVPVPVAT